MRIALALGVVAGLSGLSHAAQTIATSAIFGATTQHSAQCVIGNPSTRTIAVQVSIVDESGNPLQVSSTCNEPIPAGFNCSVFANSIPSTAAVACSATASGGIDKLRGTFTLSDGNAVALRSVELQ